MSEYQIPEDLKEMYEAAQEAIGTPTIKEFDLLYKTESNCILHPCFDKFRIYGNKPRIFVNLIERIARLEYEVKRLGAPIKCARCERTMFPREVIRCIDCKEPLCDHHIYTHFAEHDKGIREQNKNLTSERDYLFTERARLESENKHRRALLKLALVYLEDCDAWQLREDIKKELARAALAEKGLI